ncbi:MAG TPA: hypothetical protein VK440_02995 [Burkholderiales bacterium]|nr:hypothetical protein [Burkholderiales bacterium]
MVTKLAADIILQSFLVFVVLGCIFSLILGIWMLVLPGSVLRFNQKMAKWYGTEKLATAMDKPHNIEPVLYRYHRAVGTVVLVGGIYVLYVMLFVVGRRAAGDMGPALNQQVTAWLLNALGVTLALASLLALIMGFFLVVRPSAFKRFEQWANRWYATEKSLKVMEEMHLRPDESILRNYRIVAALIIAGSIYVILSLWLVLS